MIDFELPLPPSKNVRTERKGYYNKHLGKYVNDPLLSEAVKNYRLVVKNHLRQFIGMIPRNIKVILNCVWYKHNRNQDCVNFHDELCDAIAPALNLNDRDFLVRDQDFIIVADPQRSKVIVEMKPFATEEKKEGVVNDEPRPTTKKTTRKVRRSTTARRNG
jgi:hypothetical protein